MPRNATVTRSASSAKACKRSPPVALDRLGTLDGNVRPPRDWPFKYCGCASRKVALPMVRTFDAEATLNRPGRPVAWRCSASVIVRRGEDVDVLAFYRAGVCQGDRPS